MKFTKMLATAGALAVAAVSLAACGSKSSSSSSTTKAADQTLNWTTSAEIPTMDASKATDSSSFNQLNNVLEGLYKVGKNNKIEPGIATSYKVSKDGKTYTFTLRKGAKWSNGDEVTAKDFVYSWRRTVNPKTASEYAYLFDVIKNASAIQTGKKSVSSLGVKADGKYKLVVTLTKKTPYFMKMITMAIFSPQNEKAVKKYGSKYGTASKYMVYDGPYVQTGWTGSNLSWKLKKNKYYWDAKKVSLKTINFSVVKSTTTGYNQYQSGKVDAVSLNAEQTKKLKGQSGYTVRKTASTFYLQYNFKNKYLKNKNIRKALSLVINRQQLISSALGSGTASKGFVPAGLSSYNGKDFASASYVKEFTEYNLKLAKKYWKLGLKQLGVKKVSLSLLADDTDAGKATTEYLQSAIESNLSGASISVSTVPFKTRLQRQSQKDFQMVDSGWSADYADPTNFLDLMTSSNSYDYGSYKSSTYNKYVALAESETNEAKRWNYMVKAEETLANDQAVTPLYQQSSAMLVNPKVKDVVYDTTSGTYNFKYAYMAN